MQTSITHYRKVLEELMKLKIESPNIFALFELLRDIMKYQFNEMKTIGCKDQLDDTKKHLKEL